MLKLSTKSRYGLRAMIELAEIGEGEKLEMSAIAQRQQLSRKYLHSMLSCLKEAGLTESIRGARGGYRLSRNPADILVSEIFEALEGKMSLVDCTTDPLYCDRALKCPAKPLWDRLNNALQSVLTSTTLADLVGNQQPDDVQTALHG